MVEIYLKNDENLNLSTIILSLFLILFLTKFSRLAEYGSDISGQIVLSIYFFYFLEFIYNKKIFLEKKIDYLKTFYNFDYFCHYFKIYFSNIFNFTFNFLYNF